MEAKMRIIAGIMMMIVSFTLFASVGFLTTSLGETGGFVLLSLLLVIFVWGNAIDVFMRKRWKWAFSGAICSVLIAFTFAITSLLTFPFPFHSWGSFVGASLLGIISILMGILAVVFLIKCKSEFRT